MSGFNNVQSGMSMGYSIGQSIAALYSGWESGRTNKFVAKMQAKIAEQNRQMAQMAAESAFRQGEAQIASLTYQAGQVKAQQRAAFGANGVRIGVGSTAEVTASTDTMKRLDVLNVRMSALNSAWGYKQEAYRQEGLKGAYGAVAKNAMAIGLSNGILQSLRYAAEAGEKYAKYKSGMGSFGGSSGSSPGGSPLEGSSWGGIESAADNVGILAR